MSNTDNSRSNTENNASKASIFAPTRGKSRRQGSIPPEKPVTQEDIIKKEPESPAIATETPVASVVPKAKPMQPENAGPKMKDKKQRHTRFQTRITGDTKNKMDALKTFDLLDGKPKYDYEIVALLLDYYMEKQLTAEQKSHVNNFLELRKSLYE